MSNFYVGGQAPSGSSQGAGIPHMGAFTTGTTSSERNVPRNSGFDTPGSADYGLLGQSEPLGAAYTTNSLSRPFQHGNEYVNPRPVAIHQPFRGSERSASHIDDSSQDMLGENYPTTSVGKRE